MSLESPLEVIYKTINDSQITTDIYLPSPNTTDGKHYYPVDRGWIVVVPNHRLCPQVNILEGPIQDCRDLLRWIYDGHLDAVLAGKEDTAKFSCDLDRVIAFGTSSGGTIALSLGYDVERPVAAIYDLYGPAKFSDPFWTAELPHVAAKLPPGLTTEFINQVYQEHPVPTRGGVSLEGQAESRGGPDFSDPRQAFALTQIAQGKVIHACYPPDNRGPIDPVENISPRFPPTFIVHGAKDTMVTIEVSRALFAALKENGVECDMIEVPDEDHTFAAKMEVGSRTWNLQRQGFDFLQRVISKTVSKY
ncbi:hypothetical protein Plec18170_009070 [Paecilomyces lecythidis]